MAMKIVFFVLACLFISGCNSPSAAEEQTWNDAADAIDRLKEFKRVDTEIEAKRLLQKVEHTPRLSGRYLLLSEYYYAVDLSVRVGDKDSIERADVCGEEVRGRTLADHKVGDCKTLTEEFSERMAKPSVK
jgi:hypothetical protein